MFEGEKHEYPEYLIYIKYICKYIYYLFVLNNSSHILVILRKENITYNKLTPFGVPLYSTSFNIKRLTLNKLTGE